MKKTTWCLFAVAGALLGVAHGAARAEPTLESARPARLLSSTRLAAPRAILQQDTTIACFEGLLSPLLNPGCFDLGVPPHGDCASKSTHFLVQYLFPDVQVAHRLIGIGFLSNDDATVFPSAGVVQIAPDAQGRYRFPTATELANLQATQVQTVGDTSVVFVDLEARSIMVQPGDAALVVCLQFPQGGTLTAVGLGPGIAADGDVPDQDCDFFTVDGGTSGTWYAPGYDPGDPQSQPLDWGFVVLMESPNSVDSITWTRLKSLYRTP